MRPDATALAVVGVFGYDGADHPAAGGAEGKAPVGGQGADTPEGGGEDDTLIGGAGSDDGLDGGADTVSYGGSDAGVTVSLADAGAGAASGGHASGDRPRGFEHVSTSRARTTRTH